MRCCISPTISRMSTQILLFHYRRWREPRVFHWLCTVISLSLFLLYIIQHSLPPTPHRRQRKCKSNLKQRRTVCIHSVRSIRSSTGSMCSLLDGHSPHSGWCEARWTKNEKRTSASPAWEAKGTQGSKSVEQERKVNCLSAIAAR